MDSWNRLINTTALAVLLCSVCHSADTETRSLDVGYLHFVEDAKGYSEQSKRYLLLGSSGLVSMETNRRSGGSLFAEGFDLDERKVRYFPREYVNQIIDRVYGFYGDRPRLVERREFERDDDFYTTEFFTCEIGPGNSESLSRTIFIRKALPFENAEERLFWMALERELEIHLTDDALHKHVKKLIAVESDKVEARIISLDRILSPARSTLYDRRRVSVDGFLLIDPDYFPAIGGVRLVRSVDKSDDTIISNDLIFVGWSHYAEERAELEELDGKFVRITGIFRFEEEGFPRFSIGSVTSIEAFEGELTPHSMRACACQNE